MFLRIALALALSPPPLPPGPLQELLRAAGDYVLEYERDASGVVLEESYHQRVRSGAISGVARTLVSDFVLVSLPGEVGLLGFRDVFQVDGRRVRDRDARLERLFLTPSAEGVEQAKRVLDESARYNVGATRRNYNLPTIALAILHPAARERFSFRDEGARKVKGRAARAIAFDEQATPTLIRDPERDREYFSRGMFLIEIETGALLRSELRLQHEGGRAAIEVEYEWHPALALWLPETMSETLESRLQARTAPRPGAPTLEPFGGAGETLIGQARYRKPRRFTVTTEEKIQPR